VELSRIARLLGGLAAAVGILCAALLTLTSAPRETVVDGYVLFVGGLLLAGLVAATRAAGGSGGGSLFERALHPPRPTRGRLRALARLEREVALGTASAFDAHVRVRPHLRQVAAHRLASRRGLDLDTGAPATRALLGEELWELLRPDRPPPADRFGPGLPLASLRSALDRLERI